MCTYNIYIPHLISPLIYIHFIHSYTSTLSTHIYIYIHIIYIYSLVCAYIYIYHIFFIHSSIDGHLGYSHTLAIINNAAMNTGVHISN